MREPDGQRRDPDAAGIEHLQRVDEPLAFLADERLRRHAAILEDHFARVARAHPELVLLLAGLQPRRAALDDERRDAAPALRAIGDGDDDERPRDLAVRDELLGAVDDPLAARPLRGRTHRRGVRARPGLRQTPAAEGLAARQRQDVLPALRLVAEHRQMGQREAVVRRHRQRHTGQTRAISSMQMQ